MSNYNELLSLHAQYTLKYHWDNLYNTFFDIDNKTNIDKKIKALKMCLDEDRIIASVKNYEELLDNYPTTEIWDLII